MQKFALSAIPNAQRPGAFLPLSAKAFAKQSTQR